ncbi:hypothetical protein PR048_015803 [Dryococelus australis]|uniref:Uncharacterized protein n=1 Tax=Dryococelus australis TaxID=614101 RepID=A0ABQ9HHY7_9NEOP|nr:hypothetical protein PR048_015803 [Dryococelus australis]
MEVKGSGWTLASLNDLELSTTVSLLASTKVNQAQSPNGSLPDFRKWESCLTMPLVGVFSRGSLVFPAIAFRRCSLFTPFHPHRLKTFTRIVTLDLGRKRRFAKRQEFRILVVSCENENLPGSTPLVETAAIKSERERKASRHVTENVTMTSLGKRRLTCPSRCLLPHLACPLHHSSKNTPPRPTECVPLCAECTLTPFPSLLVFEYIELTWFPPRMECHQRGGEANQHFSRSDCVGSVSPRGLNSISHRQDVQQSSASPRCTASAKHATSFRQDIQHIYPFLPEELRVDEEILSYLPCEDCPYTTLVFFNDLSIPQLRRNCVMRKWPHVMMKLIQRLQLKCCNQIDVACCTVRSHMLMEGGEVVVIAVGAGGAGKAVAQCSVQAHQEGSGRARQELGRGMCCGCLPNHASLRHATMHILRNPASVSVDTPHSHAAG